MSIDPVCAFHGKRRSEHVCLYCCLCFKDLTPEECWADENGQKWDVCEECGEGERGGPARVTTPSQEDIEEPSPRGTPR